MAAVEQQPIGRRGPHRANGEARTLPHNGEAEASILGGIIIKNEVLGHLDMLETDMFYDQRHKVVFEAIRNLDAARQPIDVVSLENEIERAGKLDAIGGIAYLGQLCLKVPTAENVVAYAKIVRDHHLVRETVLAASRIVERGYNWEYQADELLGEGLADLQRLEIGYREASEALPLITVDGALDELERLARTPVYTTPFPEMNKTLGFDGLLGGQVYYLAGGTGFGKTSFVATIVLATIALGRPALIAFYEMFAAYYIARMAAGPLGVSANDIIRGRVDRALIRGAIPHGVEMLDAPSMRTLRRAAERHVRAGRGAPLIVVDYVQLLGERILATMPRPDARLAASQASAGLRELAKETGAAIIAVSAAGRAAGKDLAKDVRKRPARELIAVSRESGSIEYDGAGVIVVSVSDDRDGDEDIATISVAKARFGITTHIDARYDGRTGAWREIGKVATVLKLDPKPDDGSTRSAIVAVLTKFGPQKSKSQIHKLTGKNKTAVLSEIDVMIDHRVVVYAEGEYRLAGAVPDPQLEIGEEVRP